MRSAFSISRLTALLLLPVCLTFGQTASKTTSARKKSTSTVAAKRPVTVKGTHSTAVSRRTTVASAHDDGGSARAKARKVVVTRKLVHGKWVRTTQIVHSEAGPSFQTHPDTERYQQIQQALAQKGYFKGEANGTWGDDSTAALKQYQTDQKIPNDGKITALSLIGLGLGPNRETAASKSEDQLREKNSP